MNLQEVENAIRVMNQAAFQEFGEGIDRICSELETKGCAIPSFHVDAFILKATLMAEWTTEKEFDRPSTAQVLPKYRPSRKIDFCNG